MTPPNPFEPPAAPVGPPPSGARPGGPSPGWALLRDLSVAGLGCGVPICLGAAMVAAIAWYAQVRAGYLPSRESAGVGALAAYLGLTAGLGVVARRAWSAGRWRLAFGTTFGFGLLFPMPMMIVVWNVYISR